MANMANGPPGRLLYDDPSMRTAAALPGIVLSLASVVRAEDALQEEIRRARDKVYPALVNIQVVMEQYDSGRPVRFRASGSGVIVTPDGFAITNHHVAGDSRRLLCALASGEEIPADLVGTDPQADIAVIRLRLEDRKPGSPPLHHARLGDSGRVAVGDYVLAMGNPMSQSNSVSLGIVSNSRRVNVAGVMDGEPVGAALLWIQHDALIIGGNSGGPLVNLAGEVVGINESMFGDPRGGGAFGMAVPANAAREVLKEILATAKIENGKVVERGRVVRSWLGLSVQTLLPEMKQAGQERGILVSAVMDGSPAAQAGLAPGDRILRLAGVETDGTRPEGIPLFIQLMSGLPLGSDVEVQYARGTETRSARMRPIEWEKRLGRETEFPRWGFTARQVTGPMARELKLDGATGALVTGVRQGGAFGTAKPPVAPGGIVRAVDGRMIRDMADLRTALSDLAAAGKECFPLEVEAQGSRVLSVVEGREKPDFQRPREIAKAWLGIDIQIVTPELARVLGLSGPGGIRVTQVYPEAPGAAAGLAAGDVYTTLDGETIPATRPGENDVFVQMIRRKSIGQTVELAGFRDGKPHVARAVLAATPMQPGDAPTHKDKLFEFVARDIVFADRVIRRWDKSVAGCVVESVESSGWAGWSGLAGGDLIQQVDAQPIAGVADLARAMERIGKERPAHVIVKVLRGGASQFVDIEPEWENR